MVSAPWLLHVDQISGAYPSLGLAGAIVQSDEPRMVVSLAIIVTCSPCRKLRRSLVLDAIADSGRTRVGGHVLCCDALSLCRPAENRLALLRSQSAFTKRSRRARDATALPAQGRPGREPKRALQLVEP